MKNSICSVISELHNGGIINIANREGYNPNISILAALCKILPFFFFFPYLQLMNQSVKLGYDEDCSAGNKSMSLDHRIRESQNIQS